MIDLCTVVFRQELPVLRLQAQSIALYCRNLGIRNIYVVVNDDETLVNEIDPAWWGELAPLVLVVPRTAFSAPWVENGWLSQQLWKLLVPSMSYNTCTMVLDAKTIFVKPITLDSIFDESGRIATGTMPLYEVFEPAKKIVDQTYNINLQQQIGPGGVPFVFHNNTVRSMIADTANLVQNNFPEWFQSQGRLTEFVLYSGYVQYRYHSLYKLYTEQNTALRPVNLCHSEITSADRKLNEMTSSTTVSIHRNAWDQLTPEQRQQYRNLLIDRGITEAWNLN